MGIAQAWEDLCELVNVKFGESRVITRMPLRTALPDLLGLVSALRTAHCCALRAPHLLDPGREVLQSEGAQVMPDYGAPSRDGDISDGACGALWTKP